MHTSSSRVLPLGTSCYHSDTTKGSTMNVVMMSNISMSELLERLDTPWDKITDDESQTFLGQSSGGKQHVNGDGLCKSNS